VQDFMPQPKKSPPGPQEMVERIRLINAALGGIEVKK
jgi:hypothetical protein